MVYLVRTHWAGTSGGPGITQVAFDTDTEGTFLSNESAQVVVNAMRQFWLDINGTFSNDLTLTVDPVIDAYTASNGDLTTSFNAATPPAAVTGSSADAYSMASGYKVNILTTAIKNNRRVRGGFYVVPAVNNVYTTGGVISSSTITTVVAAAVTLQTAFAGEGLEIGVWSRPKGDPPAGGSFHPTSGMSVNSKVAVLRGRRD